MATADFLRLSSPLRFAGCQTFTMSSSPIFPSPGALVRKRPQLKFGTHCVPSPSFATASFSTAPGLLNEQSSEKVASATIDEPITGKVTKTKVPRKPKTVERGIDGVGGTVKKPRKSRAKKADVNPDGIPEPVVKAPRKPRAKRDGAESQSKIPRGRITKASAGSGLEKAGKGKKTAVVSSHFALAGIDDTGPSEISSYSENSLLLQVAVKRRETWTPPKKSKELSNSTIITTHNGGGDSADYDITSDKQKTITELLASFGYKDSTDSAGDEPVERRPASKKRKLIEMATTNDMPAEPKAVKVKAVKKKPRTITELAISAFATDVNQGELTPPPAPILKYCTYLDSSTEQIVSAEGFKVPSRPRSSSPVKVSSKYKCKKGLANNPTLLSPQSALKQVAKQEFVFGTSSQLAREDSPTLLRDLQQAMQASNKIEEDSFLDIENLSPSKATSADDWGTEAYIARRNLWAAASNGFEAPVTSIETVNVSEPRNIAISRNASNLPSAQHDIVPGPTPTLVDDEWHDLEADEMSQKKINQVTKLSPAVSMPEGPINLSELPTPHVESSKISTLSKATAASSKTRAKGEKTLKPTAVAGKPDYNGYSTAKLAKEVASYHFKAVKGRDQMISLLEKCWEGRQQVAASIIGKVQEAEPPASDTNKLVVLRQTPQKVKKKISALPEEIEDSDSPITPSPPRRRNRIRTPTPALQLSVSDNPDESLILCPTSQQLQLHKHITRAITSVPPSQDPANPTWHEKILLYDPIILEDLASWLNTGALGRVGWDGEVGPQEVKRWCLEKSICCLWRENLRGEARSRY